MVELHHLVRLDRSTLIERFNLLLANYVGDPLEPRWSLYHLVTEIWGEVASITDEVDRGPLERIRVKSRPASALVDASRRSRSGKSSNLARCTARFFVRW